jgi:hypothetical protein
MARSKPTEGKSKHKLTLSIDREFCLRFAAYAASRGEDMSDVAARALKVEMKGFSIRHRNDPDVESEANDGGTVRMDRRTEDREAG